MSHNEAGTPLGAQMAAEMADQPDVLAGLVGRFDEIAAAVAELASGVEGVAFLARGSSDHSALLGRYLVELGTGLPTSLVAPSLLTAYHRRPDRFEGWLLVAMSQSGRTPEIVDIAARYAVAGARVIAVTNDAGSALARGADLSISVDAGAELAVPATKTVTGQMLASYAIAAGLGPELDRERLDELPAAVTALLVDDGPIGEVGAALADHDRMAVVGRGILFAPALETALKLQETTSSMAHGFSTADFRHGPIAVCGPDCPAVLFAGSGPVDDDTRELVEELATRGTGVHLIGTEDSPAGFSALGSLEAILATVRGQQLALAVCRARGIDPDHPGGLNKVTLTR